MTRRIDRRRREVHVYRDAESGRWIVSSAGRRLSGHYRRATAVLAGRRAARKRRADLNTHALDGRVRTKDSHGNESPRHDK
jgi:hypothetical protein